jgi:F0F1-type ATP synthase membrane subunit b/b'
MSTGIMDYKDPSGKNPVHYGKIMKKLKLTREEVNEESLRMNKVLPSVHFEEQEEKRGRPKAVKVVKEKTEKKKGRPKKMPKGLELESKTTDLFASLIASSVSSSSSEIDDMCEAEFIKNSEENGVKEIVVSAPEMLNVSIVEENKKISKDEAKALEKAKKEEAKLLKEQEKALEKAKKEEAKALEKAKKEEEKALEKSKKDALKTVEKAPKKAVEKKVVVEEEEEADVVKKIKIDGVTYLKSKKSGVVYNMEQDVIGKWDDASQKIIFNPVDAELEEDECESDSE